ncbi:MAG: GNAT family N-acetyltransferase [Treponema sp.]|jgi:predicted acetyltransferase|nr:GNAT family N-acetyltransferase [Treponema sp.]
MFEVRRLESEDLIQFYKMNTIVYNLRRNYTKDEIKEPDPLDHPADWAWGVFEGKKLLAGMMDSDFLMNFDGNKVKLSGIGGVGTLPEARKDGHIRRIFDQLLPESYEKGFVFSNLSPFSHDFYRKFGYEICCARNDISIPAGNLHDIKSVNGEYVHIFPGDDTSLLEQVHSAYVANVNHGIYKNYWPDNRAWKRFTREDPYSTGTYLYLWKNEKGVAKSYIKYKHIHEDDDNNMSVSDLIFADKEGLYGALGFVSRFSAQFENFKWKMPSFIDPTDFTGNAWSIEMSINPREMTRVVNVKTALEFMRRPDFSGEYVIEVEDENITANTGKCHVEFAPEGTKVSITSREADIKCDIHTLSQLITGYRSLENAMYSRYSGLEVLKKADILKKVFTLRPQHITEYF